MPSDAERIARLEEQVRILCHAFDFNYASPDQVVPTEVQRLAREGHEIEAIKRLRQISGAGLVQAKRMVDAHLANG